PLSLCCHTAAPATPALPLHDALPISPAARPPPGAPAGGPRASAPSFPPRRAAWPPGRHPQENPDHEGQIGQIQGKPIPQHQPVEDRKSTRLNSSHVKISYAVFCLKKK